MWALLDNEGRKGSSAAKFISGLSIISLFVFIFGSLIYGKIASESMTHIEKTSTTQIYSLSAQTNTEGSVSGGLFCISGSCGGVDYYYMMKQKDDGYEKIKVPCSKALIIESTGKPHLDSYSTRLNKDVSKFWFCGDRSQCENVVKYKIYVPKNSVKYEFKPN